MKENKATAVLCGAMLLASANSVSAGGASIQVGFLPVADIEIDDAFGTSDLDGDGLSLQAAVDLTENVFLFADYYARETDDLDIGFDNVRVGVGYAFASVPLYIAAGYERYKVSTSFGGESEDGAGIRGGMKIPFGGQFYISGELGVTALEESTAGDAAIGLGFQATPQLAFFVDYRATVFEPDNDPDNAELTVTDLRLGARFDFDI